MLAAMVLSAHQGVHSAFWFAIELELVLAMLYGFGLVQLFFGKRPQQFQILLLAFILVEACFFEYGKGTATGVTLVEWSSSAFLLGCILGAVNRRYGTRVRRCIMAYLIRRQQKSFREPQ